MTRLRTSLHGGRLFLFLIGLLALTVCMAGCLSSSGKNGEEEEKPYPDYTGPNVVYIDNISIVPVDDEENNLIVNGDFSAAAEPWEIWLGDGGVGYAGAEMEVVDGELKVDIAALGTVPWSPQVYQDNIAFLQQAGISYRVTFDARADVPRLINVQIGKGLDEEPWFSEFMPAKLIVLDTEMETYSFDFFKGNMSYDDGKMVFELGPIEVPED